MQLLRSTMQRSADQIYFGTRGLQFWVIMLWQMIVGMADIGSEAVHENCIKA